MNLKSWLESQDYEVEDNDVANFKKRNYMHYRDESFSAKVKEKEKMDAKLHTMNISNELRNFVRIMLISPSKKLINALDEEHKEMSKEDFRTIIHGVSNGDIDLTEETLENMPEEEECLLASAVAWMNQNDVRRFLNLTEVVSTKITGYEKEIFVLRCIKRCSYPVVYLRLAIRLIGKGYHFEDQELIPLGDII